MRIWRGRHAGPLFTAWVVAIVLVGGLYYTEYTQPALSELLVPVYVVIGLALAALTFKWFRERDRGHDRRGRDRRRSDRRV